MIEKRRQELRKGSGSHPHLSREEIMKKLLKNPETEEEMLEAYRFQKFLMSKNIIIGGTCGNNNAELKSIYKKFFTIIPPKYHKV